MTTTQERRYRVCEQPVGTGRDLLLDRAVTTVRLAHDRPERLARALRSRGAGPWLHVLDAFEQDGEVVVVLPAHTGTFSEQLPHLSGDDAEALATGLQSALDELAAHGLSVVTLDPARIATTDDGQPVLVPVTGTGSTTAAMAPLLAVLGGVPAADASTMGDEHRVPAALDTVPIDAASADTQVIDTRAMRGQVLDLRDGVQPHAARPAPPRPGLPGPALPRPALTRPAVHVPEAAVPVRFPRPGLTEAETGRRPSAGWPRTTALSLGAASLVLGTGLLLTSQGDDVGDGLRAGQTASPGSIGDGLVGSNAAAHR